jgi:peptide/nickel transport system substrate-binding protein
LISCGERKKQSSNFFRYNETTGIASLDPAFAKNQSIMWAVHQLYNTLVEMDDNLNVVPSLAESWDISPDRRQYIFHLRTDVFFHDNDAFENGKGRRLTAYDIVFSLQRIMDKNTASSGAWIFNNRVDPGKGFTAFG